MKYVICFSILIVSTTPSFAWDNSYEIERNPYGSDSSEIQMQQRYNYDPSSRYRGNIDNDGYGTLRNQDGSTFRVRPR